MRILVVDDEQALANLVRMMLASDGHHVEVATDGVEAVEKYRELHPDLLLCDIFMPKKSGLKAIMDLRREFPDVRVIAMSGGGKTGAADALRVARSLGAADVLKKPFDREKLLKAVHKVAAMPAGPIKLRPRSVTRKPSAAARPKSVDRPASAAKPRSVTRAKSADRPRSVTRPKSVDRPKSQGKAP